MCVYVSARAQFPDAIRSNIIREEIYTVNGAPSTELDYTTYVGVQSKEQINENSYFLFSILQTADKRQLCTQHVLYALLEIPSQRT